MIRAFQSPGGPIAGVFFFFCLTAALLGGSAAVQGAQWTIPGGAAALKSPVQDTPQALEKGQRVFESQCRRCHGAGGQGRGPQSDPEHPAADLTDASRAEANPDGVLFYKVWNGNPPMPAFKSRLGRDEVWAVVEYVKTLRRK